MKRLAIAAALGAVCAVPARATASGDVALFAQGRVVAMETTVNGEKVGAWPYVEEMGILYVAKDAVAEWRVKPRPGANSLVVRGAQYVPLSAIPGFDYKVAYSTQSITIQFSPEAFEATKIPGPRELAAGARSPVLPSVFLNYDLNYDASLARGGNHSADLGAVVEAGGSVDAGVITSSFVGHSLLGSNGAKPAWTRLETAFTRATPATNTMLRIGDSQMRPSTWGSNALFAGVQYGTDYSLTPGFLTRPIPVISGVSAAPSTVELYVNNVLKQVAQVPPGPFTLGNTTALTGAGEARLVVRDVLGREMVTTQPFFTSPGLLAKGLSDWGAESGVIRRDYGQKNFQYGPAFASGTWRYGVTDTVTVEAHSELSRSVQNAGAGVISALPGGVLGRASLAIGKREGAGLGAQWLAGATKQFTDLLLAAEALGSTKRFGMLGQNVLTPAIRYQVAGNVSLSTDALGVFGLGAATVHPWATPGTDTLTANYSLRLGKDAQVSFYASKAFGEGAGLAAGATLSINLDRGTAVSATVSSQSRRTDAYVTAAENAVSESRWGWRALAGRQGNQQHAEAGLYYQGFFGNVSSEISSSPDQTALRLQLNGGLVFAERSLFVTRHIDQAYAVVEAKDLANVEVGVGGNYTGRTNGRGLALVPNLSANVQNQIRLNANAIPAGVEIDSIERTVVPSLRSAVKVDFPVHGGRGALISVVLDDGQPVPPGATVRLDGADDEFIVARRGQVYVTGLQPNNVLQVSWDSQSCRIPVELGETTQDQVLRIGPLACKGVRQ